MNEKISHKVEFECNNNWVSNVVKDSLWAFNTIENYSKVSKMAVNEMVRINNIRCYSIKLVLKEGYYFEPKKEFYESFIFNEIKVDVKANNECNEKALAIKASFKSTDYAEFKEDGIFWYEHTRNDEKIIRYTTEMLADLLNQSTIIVKPKERVESIINQIHKKEVLSSLKQADMSIKSINEVKKEIGSYKSIELKHESKTLKKIKTQKVNKAARSFSLKRQYFIYRYIKNNKIMYVGSTTGNSEEDWKKRHASHLYETELPYGSCDYVEVAKVKNNTDKMLYEIYYINKPDKDGYLPLWNVATADQETTLTLPDLEFIKYSCDKLPEKIA